MRAHCAAAALFALGCTGQISQGGGGVGASAGSGGGPSGLAGTGGNVTGAGGTTPGGVPVEGPSPRLLRQLTNGEYRATVGDLLGLAAPDTTAIPPDVSVAGFTTNVTGAFVTEAHLDAYSSVGAALATRALGESYAKVVPCKTKDQACAAQFVESFGKRAFRRPLTAEEKARYLTLFDAAVTGGDFDTGVQLTVRAFLVSPAFLFRSELGRDAGGGRFVLTPHEIASALSYTYWGTMPDDELFAAADSGALANRATIETQARRLLNAPRGRARIAGFFSELIEAPRAFVAAKDMGTFPSLYSGPGGFPAVIEAMRAEEDAFVTNVVFDSTKKFSELFTADYVYVNDRLAGLYGLPAPGSATAVKKVALPPGSKRGGLLTLGMFLLGHGRADQSSPTQRGHLIRAGLLCADVPPPPPGVDATVKPGTPGKTGRQQIEAITGSGTCAACHTLMNPIGYALEGFDGAGLERTMDGGEPVDTSGALNKLGGQSYTFNGPRELSAIIAQNAQAKACLAESYHRFTRGFVAKGEDHGAVEKLGGDYATRDLDLPELFVQLALQDSFVTRRSAEVVER
jgi:hypothetical protein